jgi:hypothetical protein
VAQILCQRVPEALRQRQDLHPPSFARDLKRCGSPIHIIQPQAGGLPGAQTQIDQTPRHRIVTLTFGVCAIEGAQ